MSRKPFLPVAPLMIEHRLIERMIEVMRRKTNEAEESGVPDVRFIDTAVDFIRTYADRLHHGKEEGILFRDLALKPLSEEHRCVMDELVAEHKFGRETTAKLVAAKQRHVEGDSNARTEIIDCLFTLTDFYPKHIEKEDRHFFVPVMRYFTAEEQDRMLAEEYEFDRRFVHVHYGSVVDEWVDQVADPGQLPV
jgi:hemerythrin-like domain-containing protein